MKNLYKILLLAGLLGASGCERYLDVKPKGYTLLNSVSDYNDWLNARQLSTDNAAVQMRLFTDAIDVPKIEPLSTYVLDLAYLWAPQFNIDISDDPFIWINLYGQVYYFNTVLRGINEATGGSDLQRNNLRAEALLGRAYNYFYLINLYGRPYNSATADQDLAVPFVTSNDVSVAVPPRSTVKDLYQKIITDLNNAIPDLPASNAQNRYRGSVAAAYSLLARIYLYRGEYAAASQNAQQALNADASLKMLDYNVYNTATPTPLPNQSKSPDAIYSRGLALNGANGVISVTPSVAYLQSFDPSDLRLRFFYISVKNGVNQTSFDYNYSTANRDGALYTVWLGSTGGSTIDYYLHNSGTTVAEMKLIIAEEAVRRGDRITARQQLNDVLKCRIKAAAFQAVDSNDPAVVLQKIFLERWHEFALNGGLRWLDMRRLDKEGAMPAVNRYNAANTVISTLQPHSSRYTLQIPDRVLSFNPGMPQNP